MAALCGSLLYFEGELLAVPVEVFLNLLLLYGLLLAWRRDRGRDWMMAGLIAGLAALTRPTILLFIAAFCAWTLWHRRTSAYRSLFSFVVPIALIILPVTYRNWTIEPDLVFISSNAGVNFYIGNNADYERTVSLRPGMQWEAMIAEVENSEHKTAATQSAFFLSKALNYITAQPLDYLSLLGKKVFHFWSGPETKRNQDIYYARQHSRILSLLLWDWRVSIPFGLIGPLSLLGLGLSMKEEWTPPIAVTPALRVSVHGLSRTLLSGGPLPHAGRAGADRFCCFCRLSVLSRRAPQSLYPHHSTCLAPRGPIGPV